MQNYFNKYKMIILLKNKMLLSKAGCSLKHYVFTYFFGNSSFYPYNIFTFNKITPITSLLNLHFSLYENLQWSIE